MNAEASSDLSDAYELAHKLGLLLLQLGELVNDNQQVRYRLGSVAVFVELSVAVYVIDSVLAEQLLAAEVFTFY